MIKYTAEQLQPMTIEAIRAIAVANGLDYHHKHKAETIIERIILKQNTMQPSDKAPDKAPVVEAPPAPSFKNTRDEVERRIEPYIQRGMRADFHEDDTWTFSFRGRMDSGNMQIPLQVIESLAAQVSKGGYRPPVVEINGEKVLA